MHCNHDNGLNGLLQMTNLFKRNRIIKRISLLRAYFHPLLLKNVDIYRQSMRKKETICRPPLPTAKSSEERKKKKKEV